MYPSMNDDQESTFLVANSTDKILHHFQVVFDDHFQCIYSLETFVKGSKNHPQGIIHQWFHHEDNLNFC